MQAEPLDLTTQYPAPSPSGASTASSLISEDSQHQERQASELNKSANTSAPDLLCKVCNGVASGFHFGANTCEACKVFFLRSLERKKAIKPCKKNGKCAENHPDGKLSCAHCRHQRCLELGMAKEGSRLGRTSYERKSEETKLLQQQKAKQLILDSYDNHVVELATLLRDNFNTKVHSSRAEMSTVDAKARKVLEDYGVTDPSCLDMCLYSPGENSDMELQKWFEEYRKLISAQQSCPPEMCHTYKAQIDAAGFHVWCKSVEKIFLQLLNFAKSIPGFSDLQMEDRIILLRSARCEILQVIRHKTHLQISGYQVVVHYHDDTGDVILIPSKMVTSIISESFHDFHMRFVVRITNLGLTDEDTAILGAFVIMTPERDGLQNPQQVQKHQDQLLKVLEYVLRKNHPNRKNMLAEVLLFMPMLREYTERVVQTAPTVARIMGSEASPLMYDLAK